MRRVLHNILLAVARAIYKPQPSAPLSSAPGQLQQVRELTAEERDQLAAYLKSPSGVAMLDRARAIEFRALRNGKPATWSDAIDWLISLSHVPRDTGNEFQTDIPPQGETALDERVSP